MSDDGSSEITITEEEFLSDPVSAIRLAKRGRVVVMRCGKPLMIIIRQNKQLDLEEDDG
jgi:hypothetical protein